MEENVQKTKRGLIVLGDKIPQNGSVNVKMEKLPITEEDDTNMKKFMSHPEFLGDGPKVKGDKNSGYTF